MSRRIADLLIKIGADSYEFQQKAQQVEKDMGRLEKKLTSVGKSLSMKLTAPLMALGAVSLNNADVQQQAEARLLTALKGRSDVQQRLLTQASELQSRSILGDEVIIGQQAYLASLGMTEVQIGKVIEAAAQLSAATGMTLESAVKNLAKTFGGLTGELGEVDEKYIGIPKDSLIQDLISTYDLASNYGITKETEKEYVKSNTLYTYPEISETDTAYTNSLSIITSSSATKENGILTIDNITFKDNRYLQGMLSDPKTTSYESKGLKPLYSPDYTLDKKARIAPFWDLENVLCMSGAGDGDN